MSTQPDPFEALAATVSMLRPDIPSETCRRIAYHVLVAATDLLSAGGTTAMVQLKPAVSAALLKGGGS